MPSYPFAATNLSGLPCFSERTCHLDAPLLPYTRPLLGIEERFDYCWAFGWLVDNWKISYFFIGLYLVAIFAGQRYMRTRPRFQLRGPLFLWNLSLALFSVFCAWRTLPALLYAIREYGFYNTVCSNGDVGYKQSVFLYTWLFAFSKILEFGDTAFIVLRKSPLIFLHWYHHATVCFFVWSCSAYPSPMHIYYMAINYFVHAIMYSYYAFKVLRIRVPRPVSMAITSVQLLQMFVGVYVTGYAYLMKARGVPCCAHDEAIRIAVAIYFSYIVLFVHFFIRAYVFNKPMQAPKERNKKVE